MSNGGLREDFCRKTEDARRVLYPYVKAAKIANVKHSLKGDFLIIKGKAYSTETVGDIPMEFQPSYNATRCNDKMIIFHGRESPFSNFHPSEFTIGDHTYCHNEQFYQSKKAEEFNDENLAAKIRSTKDPLECFKLGNKVKGFNRVQWSKIEENVMFDGTLAKFAQVAHLLKGSSG